MFEVALVVATQLVAAVVELAVAAPAAAVAS